MLCPTAGAKAIDCEMAVSGTAPIVDVSVREAESSIPARS